MSNASDCYTPRTSSASPLIGGIFIGQNGIRRVLPDQWITSAELMEDSKILHIRYTSCVMVINGFRLDGIFDDITNGKLGKVRIAADTEDAKAAETTTGPFVTSIYSFSQQALEASEQESSDA